MKLKVIFFGSGQYTIPVIEMLKKHNLQLVLTTEIEGPFIHYLKKHNIPFLSTDLKKGHSRDVLLNMHPDIGILASYGAIVPQFIIDHCKLGILNIHPSLLPKYKGPSPIQTTILNGDKQTGVTIIKLDNQIDHGPVAIQKIVDLTGKETMLDLKNALFKAGADLIDHILTKIEEGEAIHFKHQNHAKEVFTEKITREHGYVNSSNPPDFTRLERMIRAYYPWPGVWTEFPLYGKKRRIKLLPESKLQVEGKKVMSAKEFVNGYQEDGHDLLTKLGIK